MEKRIERIIQARQEQGLSLQQLSDMSGLSASTISRTLTGKTAPTEFTLRRLEESLGILGTDAEDPITKQAENDPMLKHYILMWEDRICRMRAHYNMLLAEKNRWIWLSFSLNIILVAFVCTVLTFDVLHPDIGWIRAQLGLCADQFNNFLQKAGELFRTFVRV